MQLTLPPEMVAKLDKVTKFRRGISGPKIMANVGRSVLDLALERELALIEGKPIPAGQVFYDAGVAPDPEPEPEPLNATGDQLTAKLAALDLLPRRDFGKGSFDLPFKRLWDAWVEEIGSPEEALAVFVEEIADVKTRTGKAVDSPRAYFIASRKQ